MSLRPRALSWSGVMVGGVLLVACKRAPPEQRAAPIASAVSQSAAVTATPPAPIVGATTAASASSSATAAPARIADAGVDAPGGPPPDDCRVTRTASRLPRTGPAALALAADRDPTVLFNVAGAPARESPMLAVPPPKPPSGPRLLPAPAPANAADAEKTARSSCALAGETVYCMDASGSVHKRRLSSDESAIVGHAIPNTQIAAAALDGGRTVVAFLSPRKTTEGLVSHAFLAVDDRPPVAISEDGSGATFVALAPRGGGRLLAMYVDARVAMTPVHARNVDVDGGVVLGPDAVVLVAGGGDRGQQAALATEATGVAHVLVPSAMDGGGFGLASARIHGAPDDDLPLQWTRYPREISGAPIAATQGVAPIRVALVRPAAEEPSAKKVVELGRLDGDGRFEPRCIVAEASSFSHLAIAAGQDGSTWIVYTTPEGTSLEQRGGPR